MLIRCNNKLKADRVCYKWINFKCWKEKDCTYDHPDMCDTDVKEKIQLEMKKASMEPETKHYQQTSNNKLKTDRVCYKWFNFLCWKGKNCTYDHPDMCDADVNEKPCKKDPCDLYHPQVCRVNLGHKVCRWGETCKFRHVHDNVQRNSHWRYATKTPYYRIHQR